MWLDVLFDSAAGFIVPRTLSASFCGGARTARRVSTPLSPLACLFRSVCSVRPMPVVWLCAWICATVPSPASSRSRYRPVSRHGISERRRSHGAAGRAERRRADPFLAYRWSRLRGRGCRVRDRGSSDIVLLDVHFVPGWCQNKNKNYAPINENAHTKESKPGPS